MGEGGLVIICWLDDTLVSSLYTILHAPHPNPPHSISPHCLTPQFITLNPPQVYSNIMDSSKRNRVCIAANSFAAGLHFGNMEIKNIEKTLLTTWNDSYIEELPDNLVKFDWNGTIV